MSGNNEEELLGPGEKVHAGGTRQGGTWARQLGICQVRGYFLVFVPTIREIRDFHREM
eukprot:SAG31_NODE_2313_length_5956_cov_3.390302_8_plen_58_part_00